MSAFDMVLAQALQLPDDERSKLVARLLRSLEADDDQVSDDEWEAAWSAELDERIREIRDGSVKLVDGDEVRAQVRAAIAALRA
jgi:putative addiction module component (TIGR02574 family)